MTRSARTLDEGRLYFVVESRVLRELGERLVKQPEVALLELVKNSYDADARQCSIVHDSQSIAINDDGHGMTLPEFSKGWMRVGGSSKQSSSLSRSFERTITGEKGIGRFAVRFLGQKLHLESIAVDRERGIKTLLFADFDWVQFDKSSDLGTVEVPYRLTPAPEDAPTGTKLLITALRSEISAQALRNLRTASMGVITPYHSLLRQPRRTKRSAPQQDPGFSLHIEPPIDESDEVDVAGAVLKNFVLRAELKLTGDKLTLEVHQQGKDTPVLDVTDRYKSDIGQVYADIRFFPRRKGTLTDLPVDGRRARSWLRDHSGVAVFDRMFRVHPYGLESDDWLSLASDVAKRHREPRSSITTKHFSMDEPQRNSTQNFMLRLPHPWQLIGVVQVEGKRGPDANGLIPSADREGFVHNAAFGQLRDLIRGAVEAIANRDRELQYEQDREEQDELLKSLRTETRSAIREIEKNPSIARAEKTRIVKHLAQTQALAERHEERSRDRESALEVMSLLGVVAGFMTHEFGVALDELDKAQQIVAKLGRREPQLREFASSLTAHMINLREFVTYSMGFIQGASSRPPKPYPARPRIQQVIRVFGKYAEDRGIRVEIEIDSDLLVPLLPVSLYNGIALNLFTNALKAITAKSGTGDRRIVFRAWNDHKWHYLEVSDSGIGIPTALRHRVFDPLFTTTATNRDPLGSGMGLGLTLVKRGTEAHGGKAELVEPPAGFATCVRVRLPFGDDA